MYFPYLRGRQNELLALRDLLEKGRISKKIIPIIEPIKLSTTLTKTISLFNNNLNSVVLIKNPQVGGFVKELGDAKDEPKKSQNLTTFNHIISDKNVIHGLILNANSLIEVEKLSMDYIEDMLIVANNKDVADEFREDFSKLKPKYSLILDERIFKRTFTHNKILLDDKFNKMDKNADYRKNDDEFFSEDHLFYLEEGYIGFSDYSIVGDNYSESGFAPYTVAIHIVYFDGNKNLRIKHFISESNSDSNNPAKKFSEALHKLAIWQARMQLDTYGMDLLMEHHKNGTYPGLGSIKKLSIMHHLELMSKFLDGVSN